MVRKLLATTALATLLAGPALAQEATQPAPAPAPAAPMTDTADPAAATMKSDMILGSQLIGETVYNGTGDNAENIGEVNDLVVGADGKIDQIVIGVGGFLGLGEKDIALTFADIDWAERDGDRWIVVNATKEQLEAQPAFDRTPYEPAAAANTATNMNAPASDATAMAPATTAPAATTTDTTAQAPAATTTDQTQTAAIDRSTLTEVPAADLRAETLVGTTVYGANDETIGEIGDIAMTADGKVDAIILDVGGFLGMGEKEVAVGMDKLAFLTDANGNKYLYTTFTKEQLEAAAAYDEGSWAEKRDEQRLMMQ